MFYLVFPGNKWENLPFQTCACPYSLSLRSLQIFRFPVRSFSAWKPSYSLIPVKEKDPLLTTVDLLLLKWIQIYELAAVGSIDGCAGAYNWVTLNLARFMLQLLWNPSFIMYLEKTEFICTLHVCFRHLSSFNNRKRHLLLHWLQRIS